MLEFKNVTKKYGSVTTALSDIDFKVEDGEFVFLRGPSGAGKTTLLRLILRELIPEQGEILLDGVDITKIRRKEIPALRQTIGSVFQDYKILSESTVRENIEIALEVINVPFSEWKDRVDHVLDLVELRGKSELFPSQLSGGELQRVSLARALVVNPKLILADEPTGNLDWETTEKLMDLFEKINSEGKTILMATHNRLIIDKMKKRVLEIRDGKIVNEDPSLDKKKK